MAEVARQTGAEVISVDYRLSTPGTPRDMDRAAESSRRVAKLLAEPLPAAKRTILVGSSMGGYVSTVFAKARAVQGLFLLAPAFYLEGYPIHEFGEELPPTAIIHGWGDSVVPYQNSIRFASRYRCDLHLVNDDHRLEHQIEMISRLFHSFLQERSDRT
jgi:acetyl esterase/lipase